MKKVVVVGGGTAGWLTALFVRRFYPHLPVQVVESEDIGIIGAGEGTVPHIISVLELLQIPVSALVKHCDATLKLGIRFVNWRGDGTSYFHSFASYAGLSPRPNPDMFYRNLLYVKEIARNGYPHELEFLHLLSKLHRVPFTPTNRPQVEDPMQGLESHATGALHFNARKLALFLHQVAESRNIQRIEGLVETELVDPQGSIRALQLKGDQKLEADFVFDCSGLHRQILKDRYRWRSYSEHLPLDRAVPFFIDHDNEVAPETLATAMRAGWCWRIPVQGRYGCGYVYDSDFMDSERAAAEVRESLGHDVEVLREFKFEAGSFLNTFEANCVRVGLSQGFIEPLEATSIWITCLNLVDFMRNNGIYNQSPVFRERYNADCLKRNEDVLEFIYLHYMGGRADSPFWREFSERNPVPPGLTEKIELLRAAPCGAYFATQIFTDLSWFQVARGVGLLDPGEMEQVARQIGLGQELDRFRASVLSNQHRLAQGCLTHRQFISYMRGEDWVEARR